MRRRTWRRCQGLRALVMLRCNYVVVLASQLTSRGWKSCRFIFAGYHLKF